MTCEVETVEARPVGALPGRGQRACQVAARASDLQPSIGRGRSRHRGASRVGFDCVSKRVKRAAGQKIYSGPKAVLLDFE